MRGSRFVLSIFHGEEGAFFDFGEFARVVVGGGVVVVGDGVICGVDVPRACVLRCRTLSSLRGERKYRRTRALRLPFRSCRF